MRTTERRSKFWAGSWCNGSRDLSCWMSSCLDASGCLGASIWFEARRCATYCSLFLSRKMFSSTSRSALNFLPALPNFAIQLCRSILYLAVTKESKWKLIEVFEFCLKLFEVVWITCECNLISKFGSMRDFICFESVFWQEAKWMGYQILRWRSKTLIYEWGPRTTGASVWFAYQIAVCVCVYGVGMVGWICQQNVFGARSLLQWESYQLVSVSFYGGSDSRLIYSRHFQHNILVTVQTVPTTWCFSNSRTKCLH